MATRFTHFNDLNINMLAEFPRLVRRLLVEPVAVDKVVDRIESGRYPQHIFIIILIFQTLCLK